MKYKVDIIIPVYNSLEWLKLCIKSLFLNTDFNIIGKIYVIDDCSNKETKDYLQQLSKKYGDYVEVTYNKSNQGFVKNCNLGFKKSTEKYVLLLNTDCIVSKNALEKLANHIERNPKIGLICPISSVSANISYALPYGLNYMQVNSDFAKQFSKKNFDACTVVGNCLLISKNCINKTGYFDEIFGKGYTEETDYQFKAHAKGFEAKVAIDTYVYHQCRVSFGEDEEQLKIRREHLDIFFDRWGKEYDEKYKKYQLNDPIEYIKNNIKHSYKYDYSICLKRNQKLSDIAFIVNDLIINGINVEVVCSQKQLDENKSILLFNPKIKNLWRQKHE